MARFLNRFLDLIGIMWLGEDRRDWTTSLNINDYSTLDGEHNWEDLYI